MTLTVESKSFSPTDNGGYDTYGNFYGPTVATAEGTEDLFATFNSSAIAQYASTLISPTITITYTLYNYDFLQTQQITVGAYQFKTQAEQDSIESNTSDSSAGYFFGTSEPNNYHILQNVGSVIDTVGVKDESVTTTDDVTKYFANTGFDTVFSFSSNHIGDTYVKDVSVTVTGLVATNLPVIGYAAANQPVFDDMTLMPFAGLTLSDPGNPSGGGDQITIEIAANGTVGNAAGSLSLPSDPDALTQGIGGVYRLYANSISQQQADLRAIVFTPATVSNAYGVQPVAFQIADATRGDPLETSVNVGFSALVVHDAHALSLGLPASGTDAAPFAALAGVSVADPYAGDTVSATLSLEKGAGTLSGAGLSLGPHGLYYLASTDAATLTQELQGVQFTAVVTAQQDAPPGTIYDARIDIAVSASDGWSTSAVDVVPVTIVARAPTLTGGSYADILATETAQPFASATLTDPNAGSLDMLTISLSNEGRGGSLSGTGLTYTGDGTYKLFGAAAGVTEALQNLVFTPVPGQPNSALTTDFTLTDVSLYGTQATDTDFHVTVGTPAVDPVIYGAATLTTGLYGAVMPFASAVVVDANADSADLLTIQLSGAGAGGTLSGGFVLTAVAGVPGAYQLFGSAAQVTADLQSLVFTPSRAGVTSFTLTDETGAGTVARDAAFSVTTDAGPKVGTATVTVAAGSTTDITGAILAAVTPGLAGDTEQVTAIGSSSPDGSETLSNGRVVFTASGGALDHIPANGSVTVSFSDTVTDQVGDAASGTVLVTVTNTAVNLFGDPYGHSITQGTTGTDVITAYGYNDTINTNGGDDLVYAGAGQATVNATGGDVTVVLAGQNDVVNGDDGNETVSGSQGNTRITLGNGDNTVSVDGVGNAITLGNGNNSVASSGSNATITLGDGGNDVLVAGSNNSVVTGAGPDAITLTGSSNLVDAGGGVNMVFLGGNRQETLVLHAAGDDVVSGFDVDANDMLRLGMLLSEGGVNLSGSMGQLGTYLHATSAAGNTSLTFDASGAFAGGQREVASLVGVTTTLGELEGRGVFSLS